MGWVILGILVILAVALIGMYNSLVSMRNEVKNAWAGIEVQLKRRYDLIPNLVETVKGYLTHEKTVLENVVKARQQAIDVSGVKEKGAAENFLTQSLRSLFAVVENYPNLKANQNIMALQDELTSTENKISFARNNYNDWTMNLNKAVEQFPTNTIANTFGFKKEALFEVEDAAMREAPKVKF
ncbi:MAG: LemA family protein [Candidatus Omnitrophica bacterium]|nr:LemA family protein [Candidatus Omnitrophota bacterium]MBU4488151.1 LemA family protein [Candidatus Omnitrophota bacterium]MCG2704538.1 LemA family protein [Candidatus Omnitrophota bacterium]